MAAKRRFALFTALCLILTPLAVSAETIPWDTRVMPYEPHAECYLPDQTGYHDDTLDIRIETMRRDDTNVMLAYVTLTDPCQFRTATASPSYPSKRTAMVTALTKSVHAVMGINGDYFNYHNYGIAVRNTRVLRMNPGKGRDTLIVDENGDFTILSPTSQEAYDAFPRTVVHAFCFGPGLVKDGEAITSTEDIEGGFCGKDKKTQRMVIGQTGPLQYLIMTCEGPENEGSVGFDLLQAAALCKELGCINAYNLDGGSSSTISLNNKKINATSSGKIRDVGDIIFFATLQP